MYVFPPCFIVCLELCVFYHLPALSWLGRRTRKCKVGKMACWIKRCTQEKQDNYFQIKNWQYYYKGTNNGKPAFQYRQPPANGRCGQKWYFWQLHRYTLVSMRTVLWFQTSSSSTSAFLFSLFLLSSTFTPLASTTCLVWDGERPVSFVVSLGSLSFSPELMEWFLPAMRLRKLLCDADGWSLEVQWGLATWRA